MTPRIRIGVLALARSGVNDEGTEGVGGNTAVTRSNGPKAFADASAANGSNNAATSVAEGCIGEPGKACAFSAAGNGDNNVVTAASNGEGSMAQAGALDGDHNTADSAARDGGRAFCNAQGGYGNNASSIATGEDAFAASQATARRAPDATTLCSASTDSSSQIDRRGTSVRLSRRRLS